MGLPERIRGYLTELARRRETITYRDLAKALEVQPPNTIHQVTDALREKYPQHEKISLFKNEPLLGLGTR